MPVHRRQIIWILVTCCCVLCIDQVAKAVIDAKIAEGDRLFGGSNDRFFDITHERNPGLVGGMFRDHPRIAYAAPVAAMLVLLYLFRHLQPASKVQALAYGMVAGGAVGNLIDRVFRRSVVDFIKIHFYFIKFDFPWKDYPTFNIADSAICVGVFLLIICWHRIDKSHVADHP